MPARVRMIRSKGNAHASEEKGGEDVVAAYVCFAVCLAVRGRGRDGHGRKVPAPTYLTMQATCGRADGADRGGKYAARAALILRS